MWLALLFPLIILTSTLALEKVETALLEYPPRSPAPGSAPAGPLIRPAVLPPGDPSTPPDPAPAPVPSPAALRAQWPTSPAPRQEALSGKG